MHTLRDLAPSHRVLVGQLTRPVGLKGGIRVESWTHPKQAIFNYDLWVLLLPTGQEITVDSYTQESRGAYLAVRFPDVADRDAAESMRGSKIYIARSQLASLQPGQYYWSDLEGMDVHTLQCGYLGKVSYLFATPSNDVLVVCAEGREWMIPFLQPDYVLAIDLDARRIDVNWDPAF